MSLLDVQASLAAPPPSSSPASPSPSPSSPAHVGLPLALGLGSGGLLKLQPAPAALELSLDGLWVELLLWFVFLKFHLWDKPGGEEGLLVAHEEVSGGGRGFGCGGEERE